MGGEWKRQSLRESGVSLIDCVHKTPPAQSHGYPYIGIPQMKGGRIDFSANPRLISKEDLSEWNKKAGPMAGDVILSRRCNPGETAVVLEESEFALGQNLVLLRSSGERILPEFLRWLVRGPEWWAEIGKFLNVGAVFDSLRCGDIPNFELSIPPLPEQKAIARILGSLDDKIELNRKMNATLEAMAQALFKSWFVDFDPVIDNALAAGHPLPEELKHRAALRQQAAQNHPSPKTEYKALFPASFHYTDELGWIPEGWEIGNYLEEINLLSGGTPKTSVPAYWDGGIPWASAKDASQCGETFLIETERRITERGLNESATKIIPKYSTVVVSRGATTGRMTMFGEDMAMNQTCYAMRNKRDAHFYGYCHARHFIQTLVNAAHGSVFDTITTNTFQSSKILRAPHTLEVAFESAVTGLFQKILSTQYQSSTLTHLRDTLLPKLISGELRVGQAEQLAEEALA